MRQDKRVWIVIAGAVCTVVGASFAQADVIDEDWEEPQCDPMACPPGSSGASMGHGSCPSVCTPTLACTTAADCTAYGSGATCIETKFCIQNQYVGRGMAPAVVDACEPSGPCGPSAEPDPNQEPAQCIEARHCHQPNPPPPAAPASGGCAGCTVASNQSPTGPAAVLFGLALWVRFRRTR